MKFKIITVTAILITGSWAIQSSYNDLSSKPDGSPAGYSGSPGDASKTCAASGCHTGNAVLTKSGLITSNIPSTGYVPNTTYKITAKVKSPTVNRWGFEISPQNSVTGALMGQLIVTNTSQTKLVGSSKYITHTTAGNSGAGLKTWTFNWKAPAAGAGKVKFYGTFLYANNNGGKSGDTCVKATLLRYEDTIPVIQDPYRNEWVTNGINCPEKLAVSIFPNPFSSNSKIQLNGTNEKDYSYEIYTASGKVIKKQEDIPASTIIQFGDEMIPGIYFVKVIQDEQIKTMKIVKTN